MDKEKIYTACLEEIAKNDFSSLSLSKLSCSLGIKKSSLYFYAPSKESLIKDSLSYAQNIVNISSFSVDFRVDIASIFSSMLEHYASLFSSPISRAYLSCITKISDYAHPSLASLEDIIYTIETQVAVILSELEKHKRLIFNDNIDEFAHIIALLIFEMIRQCTSSEKAQWHISYTLGIITKLLIQI